MALRRMLRLKILCGSNPTSGCLLLGPGKSLFMQWMNSETRRLTPVAGWLSVRVLIWQPPLRRTIVARAKVPALNSPIHTVKIALAPLRLPCFAFDFPSTLGFARYPSYPLRSPVSPAISSFKLLRPRRLSNLRFQGLQIISRRSLLFRPLFF